MIRFIPADEGAEKVPARVFKAWFDIVHFDVIEELVDAPLEGE